MLNTNHGFTYFCFVFADIYFAHQFLAAATANILQWFAGSVAYLLLWHQLVSIIHLVSLLKNNIMW
jgi:hypothetical protein